ncbi:MAG: Gfo/Idh/MocA family oxidoreductase [Candidatus Poribacteria bacterium]|nr:Gfo/Idh/MocA family oxidoreductase [Candidatus Poribacteria bacterium]
MSGKIRWGILGPGGIAHKFADALKAIPDAEIIAVGSRDLQRADAFADTFDVPHRHGSYVELANDPEVDAVYVATPHPFHKACAMLCLEAGKAVLCEKPLTVDADQAEALIACAREHKQFLMEAMWTRFIPVMVKVREWLAAGVIGEPRMLTADFGNRVELTAENMKGRLFALKLAGGAMLDIGVYTVSLASMVFGAPTQITSLAHIGETGVDEQAAVLLGYDAGQIASLSCAITTRTSQDARIFGTKGAIYIPNFSRATSATLEVLGKAPVQIEIPFTGNGFEYQVLEVIKCLRAGKLESDVMPLDESLSIIKTMDVARAEWGLEYPPFGSAL